ncbi:hypothetical protein [Salinibacillus kushneri]|uniref:hypothetical protein n=1 Tax=Salinibacillus kushneri TaxID=237682 RepID=UPI0015A6B231|nr:hypothetical protein [Salinibacillus kushneri]
MARDIASLLIEIENNTEVRPPVVLESTWHYQAPVVQFLDKKGSLTILFLHNYT